MEGSQPRSLDAMEDLEEVVQGHQEGGAAWGRRGWGVVVGRGMQATQHTELTCCSHCTSCLTRPLEEQSTQILYKKVPTCSWAWLHPHLG